jgi:hypothetical protein
MRVLMPPSISSGWAAKPILSETFTRVQDFFKLPTVNCNKNPGGIAAFRVSLGADDTARTQSMAAQVYVLATCKTHGGTPTYSTWYQLASSAPVGGFAPNAGDTLDLKVTENAGTYTLSAKDATSGASLSGSGLLCGGCLNNSAEVTAGSPSGSTPADFGVVHFLGIFVVNDKGVGGGLVNPHWNTAKLFQSGSPRTVAGLPHSFVGPPPHSAFLDKWV